MKRAFTYAVGRKKIQVFDEFLDKGEAKVLNEYLSRSQFVKSESDGLRYADIRQWVLEFDLEGIKRMPFTERVSRLTAREFPFSRKHELWRAYCNSISYGDVNFPHRDCAPGANEITALLYANSEWTRDWAGETVFYDEAAEPRHLVLPKPGRLVLFEGAIEHKAGVPSRAFNGSRFTVALKYRAAPGKAHR